MIYLKFFEGFITDVHGYEPTHGRMGDLVRYFEKTIKEKEEELPSFFNTHYPHIFDAWTSENSTYFVHIEDYDSEEEAMDNIVYPSTPYELKAHYEEAYEEYKKFLVDIIDDYMKGDNPHDLVPYLMPLYLTFNFEGVVENDWIIHFTSEEDTQKEILESGHFIGIPNLNNLAISAGNEESWAEDGYCFGYDIHDVYYNFQNNGVSYGEYGILFRASGIKLYHNGDEELQTVFIGNQVKDMVAFDYDSKTKMFSTKDNSIREKDINVFFEKLTRIK